MTRITIRGDLAHDLGNSFLTGWVQAVTDPAHQFPYCITASGFRELAQKPGGEYQCPGCGHIAQANDPEFQCSCRRCRSMSAYVENLRPLVSR